MRQCSRSGCSEMASATLAYDYSSSTAWLDRLVGERDPHRYDLCSRHADRLSVPSGWFLDDRRGSAMHSGSPVPVVTPLAS